MKLPMDVQNYAKKQIAKKILLFLCYLALSALVLWGLIPSLSRHMGFIPILLLCLGAIGVSAYFSKVFFLVIDRNWKGKILDVKVETKTGSYSHYGKTRLCEKNTILLVVEKENGKQIGVTAETFVSKSEGGENVRIGKEYQYAEHVLCGKPEEFLRKYHIGDTVYHFRGIDRNLYIPVSPQSLTTCIVCGTENDVTKDACYHCGHSLVKPSEKNVKK